MKNYILIVDDDQLILYALNKLLRAEGYEVATAKTATSAIEKLSFCPYDLCLIDIHLPDMNGLELMKVIREMCPDTRIIIMTAGYEDSFEFKGDYIEAATNGATQFITKPFNICDLKEVVDQVLKGGGDIDNDFLFSDNRNVKKSRKYPRKQCNDKVFFKMSIIDQGDFSRKSVKAQAVDISDGGIGLLIPHPVKESQVIGFDEKLDKRMGVVVWSKMEDESECRVGVRFA